MPLKISTDSPAVLAQTLRDTASASQPSFLVVYASMTGGRSWCPDCTRAEPFVERAFAPKPETARVVYVGQQNEWKTPSNAYRQDPFHVTNLPTVIKVTGDGKWSRLVEEEVYNQKKLEAFVGQ